MGNVMKDRINQNGDFELLSSHYNSSCIMSLDDLTEHAKNARYYADARGNDNIKGMMQNHEYTDTDSISSTTVCGHKIWDGNLRFFVRIQCQKWGPAQEAIEDNEHELHLYLHENPSLAEHIKQTNHTCEGNKCRMVLPPALYTWHLELINSIPTFNGEPVYDKDTSDGSYYTLFTIANHNYTSDLRCTTLQNSPGDRLHTANQPITTPFQRHQLLPNNPQLNKHT